MQCPVCKSLLRREKVQYVEFDICGDCCGIWVSGEQFRALAAKVAADGQVQSSAKLSFEPRKVITLSADNPAARNCPKCREPMREFNYAYDSNVFLDRCGQCKGIWLDPNEIIDIAAHIQYNPKIDAIGKGLVDGNSAAEEDLEWYELLLQAAFVLARVVIFRR